MLHAHDGTLWIATLAGLVRFDGTTLATYKPRTETKGSIASSNILELIETSDHRIIVATKDVGLLLFDPKTDSFRAITKQISNFEYETRISSVYLDTSDNLWIGYEAGAIAKLSLSSLQTEVMKLDSNAPVTGIAKTASGRVIAANSAGIAYELNEEAVFVEWAILSEHCQDLSSNLDVISLGSNGNLWLGTKNDGVFIFDIENRSCTQFQHLLNGGKNFNKSDVHQMYHDSSNGLIWVASDQGLYYIDHKGKVVHVATPGGYASENEVSWISPGQNGTLWIGTYTGLYFLVPTVFDTYTHDIEEKIHAIVAIDSSDVTGEIVASYNGLMAYDPETDGHYDIQTVLPNLGFLDQKIMSLEIDSEGIWVGYKSSGLEYFSFETKNKISFNTQSKEHLISSDSISSILSLEKYATLVGTYGGGLNIISKGSGVQTYPVGDNRVIMLHQADDHSVWIGTESGLFLFNLHSKSIAEIDLGIGEGFETRPVVWDIVESDSGDLWLATMHHGIFVWPSNTQSITSFNYPVTLNIFSVSNDTVYALEKDDEGFIWGSTDRGLVKFHQTTRLSTFYSLKHGLSLSEFDFGVSHKDDNGLLYFGGNNGYTRFDPRETHLRSDTPDISLTRIVFPDRDIDVGLEGHNYSVIELSYDDYYITFEFAVLDFLDPNKNQYRYMLEGFDHNWFENGTRNTATYTNLPAGNYVLRVQGANSSGVWNREGISLNVHVPPPPWLTWWAFCFYGIVFLFLVWLGKRAYDSYAIKRMATQMAIRMHDEAERADDELQEQLEIQDDLVKSVYQHNVATLGLVADFISTQGGATSDWRSPGDAGSNVKRVNALMALEECVYHQNESLLADMHKYADIIISRLLTESAHKPESITSINDVSAQPIPLQLASPLAIALYELLDNAIAHAFVEATANNYLHIVFTADTGNHAETLYSLTVDDNGVGLPQEFDPLEISSSGLAIVKSMSDRLDGSLGFDARQGTRVTLSFSQRITP